MAKRDTSRGNVPKRLRGRIRSTGNGHRRARVLVRPRKYQTLVGAQVDHDTLSWTACFIDDYLTYLSDKEGSGWFLKRRATRSLCVIRRIKPELPPIDPENIDKVI